MQMSKHPRLKFESLTVWTVHDTHGQPSKQADHDIIAGLIPQ